jgi:hypothetical protein
MKKSYKNVLVNSTLAFVSAFFITTLFHEFGHFLSYLLYGANPTLYHNYVSIPEQQLSLSVKIVSALAGPVFSLIQGTVFALLLNVYSKNSAGRLLMLWLSLLGFVNFFGYLMITPLSTGGDTGKVAELIQIGFIYRVLIAVIGIGILIYLVKRIGIRFSEFIPVDLDKSTKRKYVYHIMFYPIILGSIIDTIFAFPLPAWVSALYTATSAFVIMISFGSIVNAQVPGGTTSDIAEKFYRSLLYLVLVCIGINRLLTMGLG